MTDPERGRRVETASAEQLRDVFVAGRDWLLRHGSRVAYDDPTESYQGLPIQAQPTHYETDIPVNGVYYHLPDVARRLQLTGQTVSVFYSLSRADRVSGGGFTTYAPELHFRLSAYGLLVDDDQMITIAHEAFREAPGSVAEGAYVLNRFHGFDGADAYAGSRDRSISVADCQDLQAIVDNLDTLARG